MARLELSLPEEFGRGDDFGRTDPERNRSTLGLERTDGSGTTAPLIVRWFRTWATGEPVAS